MRSFLFLILVSFSVVSLSIVSLSYGSQAKQISYNDQIVITSKDGTRISANLFSPAPDSYKHPAIIFINSWSLEEHEYVLIARQFALQGYAVLSYSARGWGTSQGFVEVGGPKDLEDLSAVVDWLMKNSSIDPARIGAAGVSYGGGISLLATATEPRLKAVASLSGWTDLAASLYPGETPNQLWITLLLTAGIPTGNLSSEISNMVQDLALGKDLKPFLAWAAERSPQNYIQQMNHNQIPTLIVNNWSDGLFNPSTILPFYENLRAPKKLLMQDGIHATGEASGLLGFKNNKAWVTVFKWFDHWLKGIENSITSEPAVTFQIRHSKTWDHFQTWPPSKLTDNFAEKYFYLTPGKFLLPGEINLHKNDQVAIKSIVTGFDSLATSGFPVVGSLADAHLAAPPTLFFAGIEPLHALTFKSAPFKSLLKIRGSVQLSAQVSSASTRQTLVAYLYDIDRFGFAQLITSGVKSFNSSGINVDAPVNFELIATAYNLPAGHQIGLALDSKDPIYAESSPVPQEARMKFSVDKQNRLIVPTVK